MPDRGRRLLSASEAPHKPGAWRTRKRLVNFGVAGLVALIVHTVVPTWLHGATRFVAAYDAGALALLLLNWRVLHDDPAQTRARAADEDPGRNVVTLVILSAVAVGLVAAIAIVGHGPQVRTDLERWEAYALGLIAIIVGWFLVHTVYTFRYAHLYYFDDDGDGCGGVTFPGTPEPSDYDFAYLSFTIGTSFAISDPQVTETRIRREIMVHSIISFAYNSVIIGMVINLFAGIFAAPAPGGH
ncbi:MAG: DUF1345 domain-containing protein [Candidatus Eremiobacteraeota bacterium]|nr:DUF1345 domain-containing protein [Candidatus Eremiobacteraeota bacterium]